MTPDTGAFVERISSLATHEIMNGLATVAESAGLMHDLVAMGAVGPSTASSSERKRGLLDKLLCRRPIPAPDKAMASLQRSLGRCSLGVDRIGELALALNRFLHGLTLHEEPVPALSVARMVAVLLCPTARKRRRALIIAERFPEFGLAGFPLLHLYRPLIEAVESALAANHGPSREAHAPAVHLHGAVCGERAAFVVSDHPKLPDASTLFAADPNPGTVSVSARIHLLHGEAIFTRAV